MVQSGQSQWVAAFCDALIHKIGGDRLRTKVMFAPVLWWAATACSLQNGWTSLYSCASTLEAAPR